MHHRLISSGSTYDRSSTRETSTSRCTPDDDPGLGRDRSRRSTALRRGLGLFAGLTTLVSMATSALAVGPSDVASRPELELAAKLPSGVSPSGAIGRGVVWDRAPRPLHRAFARFLAEVGPGFRASFNTTTGVPSRLFGRGVPSPGAVADPKTAEAIARAFLERHVALLAPGSSVDDFDVVSNDYDDTPRGDGLSTSPIRTVGFTQHVRTRSGERLLVRGGQVSFRFQNDALYLIGSEALPMRGVSLELPGSTPTPSEIAKEAKALVERDFGPSVVASPAAEVFVLPLVDEQGHLGYHLVRSVEVETEHAAGKATTGPIARFEVFVDVTRKAAIARRQLLHFDGTLAFHVPERSPSFGPRVDVPAPFADIVVDGNGTTTTLLGGVPFNTPQASVVADARGLDVFVQNQAGGKAEITFPLDAGATFVWDASADERVDAQLDAFIHAREVREYAKSFAPSLSFLNAQVSVNVNISDVCNAYSDGTTVNFFKSGMGCENSGRIADVVYHEYGHSVHNHAIIPGVGVFEGALSEGVSDYLAATFTGDHGMGRGFFFTSDPLRDLDPPMMENRWPDDLVGEVHEDGKIIAQALWDLRKSLAAKLGDQAGIAHANHLYYEGIRRAVDIPSMYAEVVAADDDDGNLENGTPNICEINDAFALHGLRAFSAVGSPLALEPVRPEGYNITAELKGLFAQCPGDVLTSAKLEWRNRATPAGVESVDMTVSNGQVSAVIPTQPQGTALEYSISVTFAATTPLLLPDNPADRWYELYVGDVTPLYCTDFETDPAADGWTHGLSMGKMQDGADDWEWGKPQGTTTNGDPTEAFSGKKVYGNDLGDLANHNGLYQPNVVNYALSPAVDVTGYDDVRLQYRRWLEVEDGHFDHATIYANGQPAWQNFDSDMGDSSKTDHVDKEWRFHDVDLTPYVADGQVQVKFEVASDQGKELGGWTIDDFCIVGVKKAPPDPCAAGGCAGGAGGGGGQPTTGGSSLEPAGGCGCEVSTTSPTWSSLLAVAAAAAGLVRRRARRPR
jgi:hypothetical protein